MIPVPLAENALHTLPAEVSVVCKRLQYFFVENLREARRFLKQIDKEINIDELHFSETNRNATEYYSKTTGTNSRFNYACRKT
jgi:16S rRNA (cytidine1402-2'-O)-methyltransferase